jgi:hypothetical protein
VGEDSRLTVPLFTIEEGAQHLGIPPTTLRDWTHRLAGPAPLVHRVEPRTSHGQSIPFIGAVEAHMLRGFKELGLKPHQMRESLAGLRRLTGIGQQHGEPGAGLGRLPSLASGPSQASAGGEGIGVFGAAHPLSQSQQRGVLIRGPCRIVRRPGHAGQGGAHGKAVRVAGTANPLNHASASGFVTAIILDPRGP